MIRAPRYLCSCLLVLVTSFPVSALAQHSAGEIEQIQKLQTAANDAYAGSDWQGFLDNQRQLLAFQPDDPTLIYNTACGFALTNQPDSAIALLRKLADRGIDFGAANDPDFKSLWKLDAYNEVLAVYDSLFYPVHRSTIIYDLDPPDLLPEGIAHDPRTGRFFIGSMRKGAIYVAGENNSMTEFARLDGHGPLAVLGLEVDTIRNILWTAATAFQAVPTYNETDEGITGVYGFDLFNGRLSIKFKFPGRHPLFGYNDLTVSREGDIYLSGGPVYVIRAGTPEPVLLLDTAIDRSNGICLSPDEQTLFIASREIHAYGRASGRLTTLKHHDSVRAGNIDGMYYYDNSLVGIQHGPAPWRVARWFLNEDHTAIDSVVTLERKTDGIFTATTGALVGDDLYVIARAIPPAALPGGIPEGERLLMGRPIVLKTPLKEN